MYIESKKKESELRTQQEAYNMAKLLFDDNWNEILVCSQKFHSSMNGAFLVVYDDDTFLHQYDLCMFSYYKNDYVPDITERFYRIAGDTFDDKSIDETRPTNLMLLDIKRNGEYSAKYLENLSDYEYYGTPLSVWKYKKVGVLDEEYGKEEVTKFIKEFNIIPERILKNKVLTVPFKTLIENILFKNIYYMAPFLRNNTTKVYFHLDIIQKKYNLKMYLQMNDDTWKVIDNIQKLQGNLGEQQIKNTCLEWADEFYLVHTRSGRNTSSYIDYIYDISTGELSYVYDNITEDNFTDELALVNAWEERYFSKDGEPLLMHAVAPHEGCITGTMHIDMSQFIEEEEEEVVSVDPAIEFTGEDIHDLIPQYLQNSYDILYSILPGTYQRIYLYVENDGTVCRQLGYIIVDGEYLTFEEMIDHKVVSKATYDATMEQLALWSNYMRNAFIACHLEPWTVFSYMIDEERHISTNFGYDVLAEQTYDNELFDLWSYEKLGIKSPNLPDDKIATIVPENEYAKF